MITDRDEDICFYHFFIVYVHSKIPQVEENVVFSRTQVSFLCGLSHQCPVSSTYWVIAGDFHSYI